MLSEAKLNVSLGVSGGHRCLQWSIAERARLCANHLTFCIKRNTSIKIYKSDTGAHLHMYTGRRFVVALSQLVTGLLMCSFCVGAITATRRRLKYLYNAYKERTR